MKIRLPKGFGGNPKILTEKSILVTGGTGSFGKHFVKTLLKTSPPNRLVIFSRDEMKQYEFEQELRSEDLWHSCIRFFVGDIRDLPRLEMAVDGCDYVIHAAAMKHVTIAEYNPFECIKTNVLGSENVVQACINKGVKKVVALSTDKAAAPLNLYGASKLAADKIFIAANILSGRGKCRFSVVRYGNVIGSRGSVVPLFRKLLQQGADHIPITDPKMTRFWITLDQGVSFVLSCLEEMKGGEMYIPKLPSIKITDLATAIAPNIPQKIVGIRAGEKLHEAMLTADDARTTYELDDRFICLPQNYPFWPEELTHTANGKPVSEGFYYSSETNTDWLTIEEIVEWAAL